MRIMKILFFLLYLQTALMAYNGVNLLMPQNSDAVLGVYTGVANSRGEVSCESSDAAVDVQNVKHNNIVALGGVYLGFQNDGYRFSFSYDANSDSDISLQRVLINFDFMFEKTTYFRPTLGFGLGAAMYAFDLNTKKIKSDDGVLAFRVGGEFAMGSFSSLDLSLEYSYVIANSSGKSFFEDGRLTTYKLQNKSDIILRVSYNVQVTH